MTLDTRSMAIRQAAPIGSRWHHGHIAIEVTSYQYDYGTGQIAQVWARTIQVTGTSPADEVGDEWAYSPDKFLPANERTAA